jgi:hypothetical protein
MSELLLNTTVIIRSSGERTEGLCCYAIEQNGIPSDNIHLIKNEKPFSQALKKGYELALELNSQYTFFVDADTVVLEDALTPMLTAMDRLPEQTFSMSALAYDYCMGKIVPQGPHLYRTKHIAEAIQHVPSEQDTKRPETSTKKSMYAAGYQLVFLEFLAAFHEFEQYQKDIFGRVVNKMKKTGPARAIKEHLASNTLSPDERAVIEKAVAYVTTNKTPFRLLAGEFDTAFFQMCGEEGKQPLQQEEYASTMHRMKEQSFGFTLDGYSAQLLRKEAESVSLRQRIGNYFKR